MLVGSGYWLASKKMTKSKMENPNTGTPAEWLNNKNFVG